MDAEKMETDVTNEVWEWLTSPLSEELEADPIYGVDPELDAHVRQFLPDVEMSSAGGLFPFQAEGRIAGWPFYLRIEEGEATLRVARTAGDCYLNENALWYAFMNVDADADPREVWLDCLVKLVERLELFARLFRFGSDPMPGWDYRITPPEVRGFGVDAEAAWQQIMDRGADTEWLEFCDDAEAKRGLMKHEQWLFDHAHKECVLNPDTRVYPDEQPVFRVLAPNGRRADGGVMGTLKEEVS